VSDSERISPTAHYTGYVRARHGLSHPELSTAEGGRSTRRSAPRCSPAERYGERITYIEADLPGMAERKREALGRMGSLDAHHRVEVLDALRDGGATEPGGAGWRASPAGGVGDHHGAAPGGGAGARDPRTGRGHGAYN